MYAPVVPSKTIPDFRQKCFQTKRPQTPTLPLCKGVPPDPDPFHDCQRPGQGLKMGKENSILIRLMIQRTGRHTSTKNLLGVFTTLTHVSCYLAIF